MDPYRELGVARDADAGEIRQRFRTLAKQYHPDVNKDPGAEDRFKRISQAYEIIGDDDKRALWDEFGELSLRPGFDADQARRFSRSGMGGGGFGGGFGGGGFGGGGFQDLFRGAGGGVNVEDLLGSMFGAGGRPQPRAAKGRDMDSEVEIDLLTAVTGGEISLRLPGQSGLVQVQIPAGVKEGGKLRLQGKGYPPPGGGACGDLYLLLHIRPHPLYQRDGDDLTLEVPVTVLEAMEGTQLTVPTPTGEVRVTLPPRAGRLRLKGRGVQRPGKPGDLFLTTRVVPPDLDDPAFIEAARALEAAYDGDVRARLR